MTKLIRSMYTLAIHTLLCGEGNAGASIYLPPQGVNCVEGYIISSINNRQPRKDGSVPKC